MNHIVTPKVLTIDHTVGNADSSTVILVTHTGVSPPFAFDPRSMNLLHGLPHGCARPSRSLYNNSFMSTPPRPTRMFYLLLREGTSAHDSHIDTFFPP